MPVFAHGVPEPIHAKDTVTVNGRTWAQPDLFIKATSTEEIEAVCPRGVCEGDLRGYDLTGWTWASVEDVNALFNYYIGSDALGPGPSTYSEPEGSPWVDAFFADGWRLTFQPIWYTYAVVGHYYDGEAGIGRDSASFALVDYASTAIASGDVPISVVGGGWFYRAE
jgi:hypothetical protein